MNHPFLEEIITTQASFYESMDIYSRCYTLWQRYLKIQQATYCEDNEHMIATYRKLGTLSLALKDTEKGIDYLQKAY